MNKKLIVQLEGGLGNQLFQYFFAKSFSINDRRKLEIDNKTGFMLDLSYKRKFELPIKSKKILNQNILSFICFRIFKKIFKIEFLKFFSNIFITEKIFLKKKFLSGHSLKKNIYIIGNFQNEKYFKNKKKEIFKTLNIKKKNYKIKRLLNKLDLKKTIAIGVRTFEEMPKKDHHNVGGITKLSFYNKAIDSFKKKIKNPNFIIFSTTQNELLNELKLDKNKTIFINNETFDVSPLDKLLLMSSFKNFIISNSTFYWWAAYIAEINFKKINIIANNAFINRNTLPKRWKRKI